MLLARLLSSLRHHWPRPPLRVRGDRHCAPPEVSDGSAPRRWTDLVCGLAGHAVWLREAEPVMQDARRLHQQRIALAQAPRTRPPASRRLSAACAYAAASWSQAWRVMLNAAVRAAGATPRLVGTSLVAPTPQRVYEAISGARGTGEHAIKAVQCALHRDRTSALTFWATAMRLRWSCAASALHPALRTHPLQHTARAQAQPATLLLPRVKVAPQLKPYTDRIRLHLPSACPVTALFPRGTALLSRVPLPVVHTS